MPPTRPTEHIEIGGVTPIESADEIQAGTMSGDARRGAGPTIEPGFAGFQAAPRT